MSEVQIIPPVDYEKPEMKDEVAYWLAKELPVKNVNEKEMQQVLRLMQLHEMLLDTERTSRFQVTVWQDDKRLEQCSDLDKFMALLLDAACRETILTTKRCRYCFGETVYYWRKVAAKCWLTTNKSMMLMADMGGRYYGTGWVFSPHIQSLRRWMITQMENPAMKDVKI